MHGRDMMGGFFSLTFAEEYPFPYEEEATCAYLNSGRGALACLLQHLHPKPRRALIPRFTCDTVLLPLKQANIPCTRYPVDEQLTPQLPDDATEDDLLILTQYFGLTGDIVRKQATEYPGPVIVDATTALYDPYIARNGTFYSLRKFAPLADGGIARAPQLLTLPQEEDRSTDRALFLLRRIEEGAEGALNDSERAESDLSPLPRRMSPLTRHMMRGIPWEKAARQRLCNYTHLHNALRNINRLNLPASPSSAPFCYPLVSGIPGLRDCLIEAGIALPLLWPEVIRDTPATATENYLARNLLPLPLDQRYHEEDMEQLLQLILA